MCGIFGYIGRNLQEINEEKVVEVLKHRGPDDNGFYRDDSVLLVHLRLSILDLSANGHQPMISNDGNFVICFNGEIYNHIELRKELREHHEINFISDSDTETLLYAYKHWGKDLLNKLNGIFAFIIYDKSAGTLFIARDHFGIKPLYIYSNDHELAFSSEIKAFVNLPSFNAEINKNAFVNYVNYLWSPGEETPFTHVTKLLGGHYLEVDCSSGRHTITQYYDIPFKGHYLGLNESQLVDILDKKLQLAVKRQLLSDVPVGFFLSGGLDSSLLVAIAKRVTDKKITAYTIDTSILAREEGFADDLNYAKLVAEYIDVDLKVVPAQFEIVKDFKNMIYHLDEPQADAAPLNVLNICKQAKKDGFKVLIGGTAGDDVFSGYRRHQALGMEKYLVILPSGIKKVLKTLGKVLNTRKPVLRRVKKLLSEIDLPVLERLANYYNWLPLVELKSLFRDEIPEEKLPPAYLVKLLTNIPDEDSLLNKMLYWEMKTFLPDHNLNYTDKMSMAVGVEVRVPFLDVELVEFAAQIPPEFKMKGKETKYLLKKVAERYLPHSVIYRSKTGFGAPVRSWIINDLKNSINEVLSEDKIKRRGIFDYRIVKKLIEDNESGKIDASYSIWSLLAIESWIETFTNIENEANYTRS